jgi:hypothetical protein
MFIERLTAKRFFLAPEERNVKLVARTTAGNLSPETSRSAGAQVLGFVV